MFDAKVNGAQTAWLQEYIAAVCRSDQNSEVQKQKLEKLFYALPFVARSDEHVFLRHVALLKPPVETMLLKIIATPDPMYAGAFQCAAGAAKIRAVALEDATKKAAFYFKQLCTDA